MPSTSKAQQQAAGIALAAKRGDIPQSKLRGASKSMSSMGGGELKKFAATKTSDLPKHVPESREAVANLFGRSLIGEGGHKAGCQCGFCKNKGNIGKKHKDDEKASEKKIDEPTEPEVSEAYVREVPYVDKTGKEKKVPWVSTGKPKPKEPVKESGTDVKLSKGVNLGGPAARAYHNMTSKQAMTPEWKPKAYIKAAGELSGNAKHGQMKSFKNRSAAETTTGKHIESRPSVNAKKIVEALLG